MGEYGKYEIGSFKKPIGNTEYYCIIVEVKIAITPLLLVV